MPVAFDPRTIPVLGTDRHLPPVPLRAQSAEALRRHFVHPPAHWRAGTLREPSFVGLRPPAPAAVLLPIVLRPQPTVLLTERSAHLSSHSGQIALPGGRCDPQDACAEATALREAQEEVNLAAHHVQVLGRLPLYVTGSGYAVTPVVALVGTQARWRANPHEVADIFEVPLAFVLNPAHHRRQALEHGGVRREWLAMPWMDGATERYIWGATAGMLRSLYHFLMASSPDPKNPP